MDELYAMLLQAEESEALARKLTEETGLTLPDAPSSEIRECSDQSDAMSLFEKAWELYQQVEAQVRMQLDDMDSEEDSLLLAQTLLDIHIHPNSGLKRDTPHFGNLSISGSSCISKPEMRCIWKKRSFVRGYEMPT